MEGEERERSIGLKRMPGIFKMEMTSLNIEQRGNVYSNAEHK